MSILVEVKLKAWEKAYWYFAGQNYLDSQCEQYAKEFSDFAVQNLGDDLEDLFAEFLADLMFAEGAETDKEEALHA